MKRVSAYLYSLCIMLISAQSFADENANKLDTDRWALINQTGDAPETKEEITAQKDLNFKHTAATIENANHNLEADPHDGSRTWLQPEPAIQLERDAQLQPVLQGGVFVPSMTGGINEPKYQVRDATDEIVKEAYTGTTAYVPPGDYTVVVGSLVTAERLEFDAHVVKGSTTMIPVEWSGLAVKVVNDRGTTIRGNYEIVSLPDRSYIGLGSGALLNEGERLSTWLLWPGQYMIISAGEGYQARKNFITVELKPGELSRITLVLDEETGDILGGGEIEEMPEDDEERWWWAGVLVGGSVRYNHTADVVGKAAGQLLDISVFLESYFTLGLHKHFLYTRLNAEIGGTIRFEDRPFFTTVDDLNLELLYTYRVVDWFGPYGRFSFESNMAPAWQELATPHTIQKLDADGNLISVLENQRELKLSPSFSPLELNAGAGARFDYTFGFWLKLSARLGLAYRHVFTRDLYIVNEIDDDTQTITLNPVLSSSQFGAEAALTLDLTPIQWFTLKVDASLLEPFYNWRNPVVDIDVDAAIRLSSIASISYTLRLNYDIQMIDKVQIDQYVQLRISYKIY